MNHKKTKIEIAKMLGVSPATLRSWLNNGTLTGTDPRTLSVAIQLMRPKKCPYCGRVSEHRKPTPLQKCKKCRKLF